MKGTSTSLVLACICCLVVVSPLAVAQQSCLSSAAVLMYGTFDNVLNPSATFQTWLTSNIGTSSISITSTSDNTLIPGGWDTYNLVIIGALTHTFSPSEQQAVLAYLNQTGVHNIIALAGFVKDDETKQGSPFAGLGVTYDPQFIWSSIAESINPTSPLTIGVSFLDFNGGYSSTLYSGPGSAQYIISSAYAPTQDPNEEPSYNGPLGQTIQLPNGGRIVLWGDEWITFPQNYERVAYTGASVNQDDLFWKNAINWAGVCVPSAPNNACGPNCAVFQAGVNCQAASAKSTSKCVSLFLTDSTTGAACNQT